MAEVTHSSTSFMKGSSSADHILSGSGYQVSNAVVNVSDTEHDLYIDGQTIISDGTFVIGTTASKELIFATDSTMAGKFTTDGALDLLGGKLLIDGDTGTANQVLKTDGYGNISWADQPQQQYAFGGFIVSGQDTVSAGNLSENITLTAGSGINLATDSTNKTITISSSGATGSAENAFKFINVGGQTITADSGTDSLNISAGNNITLASNTDTDTITISATTSGDANQNAFTSVASTGQNTITAGQATDTLTIDSESNTNLDSRYKDDRDKVTVTTDTETNKVVVKNNIPKTFSMASKVPLVSQTGENAGVPLRNKFLNITTSGLSISGGGTSIGVSTRSLQFTNSSGTTSDVLMPAKSDNSTLQLTIEDSSGSTHTIDMDVAE